MAAVWVAVIVAVGALLTAGLNAWIIHMSKRQDYARQDAVAAKAAEAVRLLLEANERVAKDTAGAVAKLDQVHVMVNQQRTDMQRYQTALVSALSEAGIPIPVDQSLAIRPDEKKDQKDT